MNGHPKLSVLMAVYNEEQFVVEAIESILDQDYDDFELLIIDDGSTDSTRDLLTRSQRIDDRIRVLSNSKNLGLTQSLHYGLTQARGQFLARMDGDDISVPTRFSEQLYEFNHDNHLVICGSNAIFLDEQSAFKYPSNLPITDQEIRSFLLLGNPFIHSSVMIKLDMLQQYGLSYDISYKTAQDYELWSRVIAHGSCKNIRSELITCRKHSKTVSYLDRNRQVKDETRVRHDVVSRLRMNPNIKAVLASTPDVLNENYLNIAIHIHLADPLLSSDYNLTYILTQSLKLTFNKPIRLLNDTKIIWPLISTRSLLLLIVHLVTRMRRSFRVGGFAGIRLSLFS